jgi:ribosomal protein L11 methyltransferase
VSFRQASFMVTGEQVDLLSDALMEAGAISVDVADADAGTGREIAAFGQPGQQAPGWRHCRLSALFAAGTDVEASVSKACALAGVRSPDALECTDLADQDWVRLTRDQFKPIRISSRLWIVPTWEAAPDPRALNLRLDPGLAFGTGSHPSTRLCLQWLDAHLTRGAQVLDYGCGSGILAIAALRLGAARAVGVDIDPQALVAARDNAMQNDVAAEFFGPGDDCGAGYDVVVANILANPLIALAPLLASRTRPGGHVVLSGVLEDQAAAVSQAYSPWCEMAAPSIDEGWALVVGRRRAEALR